MADGEIRDLEGGGEIQDIYYSNILKDLLSYCALAFWCMCIKKNKFTVVIVALF